MSHDADVLLAVRNLTVDFGYSAGPFAAVRAWT